MTARYYLRDDVKIEPLVSRWHAHLLLMSPPSLAFMTRHHLAIMESFVQRPDLHRRALQRPELRGGPFIESRSDDDVAAVRRLLDETTAAHADLLELAGEIDDLFRLLQSTEGFSLEPLYDQLGPQLRGGVELAYDSSGRARFRLFEALFHQTSPIEPHQELALSVQQGDRRPFVMSTPRLDGGDEVVLRLPFASQQARTLLSARDAAVTAAQLDDWASIQGTAQSRSRAEIATLFTEQAPPPPRRFDAPRIQYIGHACVLVGTGRETLLFDPLLGYRLPGQPPRFSLRDLPERIDAAIVTHAHHDHYAIETLLQIRDRTRRLVVPRANPGDILDPSLELISRRLGFDDVVAMEPFQSLEFAGCRLRTLPFLGEHGDLDLRSKLGYRLEFDGRALLFLADSNNLDPVLYERVRDLHGPADTAFIGLECDGAPVSWAYGPLLFGTVSRAMDQTRRTGGSDAARALKLIEAIGCRRVFIYAMAIEPWMAMFGGASFEEASTLAQQVRHLLDACAERGIAAQLLSGSQALAL